MDSKSGLVHSTIVTPANVHDKHPVPDLLHGHEPRVLWFSTYARQDLILSKTPKTRDFTSCHIYKAGGKVDEVKYSKNRNKSKISVEHVFAVIKRLWDFTQARYR